MLEQSLNRDDIYGKATNWNTAGLESFKALMHRIENNNGFSLAPQAGAADSHYDDVAYQVFQKCSRFLSNNHIIPQTYGDPSNFDKIIGVEDLSSDWNPSTLSGENLRQLVIDSGVVPNDNINEATILLGSLLCRAKGASSGVAFRESHFARMAGIESLGVNHAQLQRGMSVYPRSLSDQLTAPGFRSDTFLLGTESFGASMDTVLPDIRAAMTVTLLQFHRGLTDRILHRRTNGTPYVRYVVPYAEVYDMLKSNDDDGEIRNNGDHYIPFIDLYGDPRAVSNTLTPIVPLKSKDTNNVLLQDGFIRNRTTNVQLFDLTLDADKMGFSHYNLTDVVSENVALDSLLISISDGASTTEYFEINVRQLNQSRLNMLPNVNDSGLRGVIFDYTFKLGKDSKTTTGVTSTLLNKCTDTDYLRARIGFTSEINLKYATATGYGEISVEAYNKNKAAVAEEVTTMLEGLTFNVEAYKLDACFSEENLRKSNLAIRSNVRTFDFEISNGRNIMIDYSMQQELPEFLMSLVAEATSLGQDHRALDIIVKELMHVFDVTHLENDDPNFHDKLDKTGFQYVSSQMVRPVVYLQSIDLDAVDTIRSSDYLGDVRQFVEWQLLNLTSLIYQNSFYTQQLNPNEKPKFKVITSAIIKDNILSIPHIHNHLNNDESVDGNNVEYRRVLPDGTVLDIVTCTYNYMRDKIIMIPYRDNSPESFLNFGHNWDYGTFVAHYNPQIGNAVNKRVFANSRTMVIPTCPIGLYIDVKNISKYIDMFQITNPVPDGSVLPSPSETMAVQP